ncbi:hypothetical protein [Streptomyces sp. TLI_171]|uniref:hypothetical protein n=1 Tax=Streptomyces sp. TLI_171 TaxID=1938859 RepID=UPI000C1A5EDE|nr:hypothetical protein [Streptomyces sp. TLI_171]RKE23352.1 D-mannose binding lectin [Streptomyces sp. TLI_171]
MKVGLGAKALLPARARAATPVTVVFDAGATNQQFTVPPGVTRIDFTAIGAAGGGYVESLWPYTQAPNSGGAGVAHLRLTTDGNLQYVTGTRIRWSSNTAPVPGRPSAVQLKLQTDGNLALYGADGRYRWDAEVAPVCP